MDDLSNSLEKLELNQSDRLSKNLKKLYKDDRTLIDDSSCSEQTLTYAIPRIAEYIQQKCDFIGATLDHKLSITLYECQQYFHKIGGPTPNPENKKVSMKPDGGIFFIIKDNNTIPVLIIEDKVQGTNDILKKRQATGNAIERAGKNIRGAEMLFAEQSIFPYVLFASGCDFHHTETIAKRLEMMNMGYPNHYIPITHENCNDFHTFNTIDINKKFNKSIASIFVKAHKWDSMKHGSSRWRSDEIIDICKKVIDQVFLTLN